jgi:hypothetical protein
MPSKSSTKSDMRKSYMFRAIGLAAFLMSLINAGLAQAPEKMSYQALVRNNSGALITNKPIGMRTSILQGSISGSPVYVEIYNPNPSTNANGIVTLEIGSGIPVNGTFASINWENGPYFLKTETDPAGGTNYTITGASQLLSVPYALYAKTAQSLSGGIKEADPAFKASTAAGITATDTARWNRKLSNYTETDPVFSASVAKGITAADTGRWNGKQNKLSAGQGISISGNVISSTQGFLHYIGEEYGGGVIYQVWKDKNGKEHGLIVALNNQSSSYTWSNVTTVLVGSSAQSIIDGVNNSDAIISQIGHSLSAAKLCLDLVSGGMSDWYLPAREELNMLWANRFIVNKSLTSITGASAIANSGYWSSTEFSNGSAWAVNFDDGKTEATTKGITLNVRAIRAF